MSEAGKVRERVSLTGQRALRRPIRWALKDDRAVTSTDEDARREYEEDLRG